jgi:acetyl esterase/lipase
MTKPRLSLAVGFLAVAGLFLARGVLAAEDRVELKLWPDGAPGETAELPPETAPATGDPPVTRVANVSAATIRLFRPAAGKANGCGVVICPGGGYSILAFDLEGTEIAEWLNSIGVTAVVLKYRVPRRDKDEPHKAPLQDVQRAIRLVRQNAKDWGIDPGRLGVLGFSAGGHLTVMAGTHWDETTYGKIDAADDLSCRPDFLVPVYPAYLGDKDDPSTLSPLVRVNAQTPPTFIAVTWDDKDRAIEAASMLVALKKAGVPAELHVFSRGGHGYGLRPSDNPVSTWPKLCEDWMRVSGLLE